MKKINSAKMIKRIGVLMIVIMFLGFTVFFKIKLDEEEMEYEGIGSQSIVTEDKTEVSDKVEITESELEGDEIIENTVETDFEENVPRDMSTFEDISNNFEKISEIGIRNIEETIEQVRYAETDDILYYDAIYYLEEKEESIESEYVPEKYKNAVMVISSYKNNITGIVEYGYCVLPHLNFESGEMTYDTNDYVRLGNSMEQISDMITSDQAYYYYSVAWVEDFVVEESEPLYERLAGMQSYYCNESQIGADYVLYLEFGTSAVTVLDGSGFLDFQLTLSEEYSNETQKVFYAYEDGLEMYHKLKEAKQEKLISKYAHLDGMTSDQLEKCQIEIFYNLQENTIEFKGMGTYEFFNGIYTEIE